MEAWKLVLKRLAFDVAEQTFKDFVATHGPIDAWIWFRNDYEDAHNMTGMAYVTMRHVDGARAVIRSISGNMVQQDGGKRNAMSCEVVMSPMSDSREDRRHRPGILAASMAPIFK